MLIRLAWRWLGRWHEPLVVGAAVTLAGLVFLLPAANEPAPYDRDSGPPQRELTGAPAQRSLLPLPTDAQFYREQWAREAKEFYARHPPRQSANTQGGIQVVPAAASAANGQQATAAVAHAYHADAGSSGEPRGGSQAAEAVQPAAVHAVSQRLQRWRVAACLAAGLLASLAFATVWPAAANGAQRRQATLDADGHPASGVTQPAVDRSRGEVIAIELPAAWVRVRPTMSQTLRRAILASSYLMAGLAVWGLLG